MANLFHPLPKDLSKEWVDILLSEPPIRIERIVSKGHVSPQQGWYDQVENEWVSVLAGCARLAFEDGEIITLVAGDYVNIVAHRRHKVEFTSDDSETVWLCIFYS